MNKVIDFFKKHNIKYEIFEHPAVFTCEDAKIHCANVPGSPGKNLFLKEKNGNRIFILSLPDYKRANLKNFASLVKVKAVSFGNQELLNEVLELTPGAVSPFGLLNDYNNRVEYFIDSDLFNAEKVNFHPNINTASVVLEQHEFQRFFDEVKHKINVIEI